MPRRHDQRPEGEDSSLALDTRSRAVIQQLVDEKRAALEAAAPHIPLEEYLHGGQDSLQSSIKRMRDAAASFASAGELVAPAAPAADDTARAHHSTDVAGSGTLGPGSATRRPASAPHSRTGAMGQRGAAGGTGEAPSLQRPSGHARARAERLQEEVRLRGQRRRSLMPPPRALLRSRRLPSCCEIMCTWNCLWPPRHMAQFGGKLNTRSVGRR